MLLISTIGFINSENVRGNTGVPLLFEYRGEVIPSFALQAVLLWMRIAPSEVKIDIGSSIALPNSMKIPIRSNGTTLINPNAIRRARYIRLNELLFQAQQHESQTANAAEFESIQDQIVLARTAPHPRGSTDFVAATIAAIQTNSVLRRASWLFDCAFILVLAAVSSIAPRFSRVDLVLLAIALRKPGNCPCSTVPLFRRIRGPTCTQVGSGPGLRIELSTAPMGGKSEGVGGKSPRLSRLGGCAWPHRARSRKCGL